jgi:hypothetical protein
MKFPSFGKKEYSAPQIAPVPEENTTDQNGTYINEAKRQFQVKIVDTGKMEDLALALGTLEIAKDVIKQTMSAWHMKDAQRKAILVPRSNGHG